MPLVQLISLQRHYKTGGHAYDQEIIRTCKGRSSYIKNRIMFPPLTTGYEERDGSIGERSLNFYERLAKGGTGYIVIGDVAPVRTASPTPKLYDDSQIPVYKNWQIRCISMIVKWHCRFSPGI